METLGGSGSSHRVYISLRDVHAGVPLTTFSIYGWFSGLIVGGALLLCLSPLAFAGMRILRPVSNFLGGQMALNALVIRTFHVREAG